MKLLTFGLWVRILENITIVHRHSSQNMPYEKQLRLTIYKYFNFPEVEVCNFLENKASQSKLMSKD